MHSLDAGHSGPDYARRNPLEIGVQLRNLVNRGDFLTVQYPGGQLVTRLLEVDVGARTFTFDWGALSEQNAGILGASHCTFAASPEGVRVDAEIFAALDADQHVGEIGDERGQPLVARLARRA
ncbi:flagellar brake protein, partial [Burkholderia cenocepacia]|uniref:flagellar brake protein n=1 Tax=Burkholderia cenocepacia TaxID=95486 RepID=UPI0024B7C19E